jgi:hypothetical protein
VRLPAEGFGVHVLGHGGIVSGRGRGFAGSRGRGFEFCG